MSTCKHGKSAPQDVLDDLPESQGGKGRHKCVVCAYQQGYNAARAQAQTAAQQIGNDVAKTIADALEKQKG